MTVKIPVSAAKAQLTELVRAAESGTDVVLTRHGQPVARLIRYEADGGLERRRAVLAALALESRAWRGQDPNSATVQADLYDENGLPR